MVTFRSAAGSRNDLAIRWVAVTTIVPSRFSMKKALATNSARARQDRAGRTTALLRWGLARALRLSGSRPPGRPAGPAALRAVNDRGAADQRHRPPGPRAD